MLYKNTTDINVTTFRENLTECFRRCEETGEIFCIKKKGREYFFFDQDVFRVLLKEAGYGLEDEPIQPIENKVRVDSPLRKDVGRLSIRAGKG